jgi:hypothetical protein
MEGGSRVVQAEQIPGAPSDSDINALSQVTMYSCIPHGDHRALNPTLRGICASRAGTGKSSFVCAMCMGLAGKPSVRPPTVPAALASPAFRNGGAGPSGRGQPSATCVPGFFESGRMTATTVRPRAAAGARRQGV